jgi:hypothetical protein
LISQKAEAVCAGQLWTYAVLQILVRVLVITAPGKFFPSSPEVFFETVEKEKRKPTRIELMPFYVILKIQKGTHPESCIER